MTVFWKSWILTFWPHPLSPPRGWDTGLRLKIIFDMFLRIYCTSVCMWNFSKKYWQLTELLWNLNIWPFTTPRYYCFVEMWSLFHKKSQYSFCISRNLSQKRAILSQKFANDLWIRPWPVFYDTLPFCKIWKKLLHPFKSYWSETTNWQFSKNLSKKKGHNSVKILWITPLFQTWPVFNDAWPFCKV